MRRLGGLWPRCVCSDARPDTAAGRKCVQVRGGAKPEGPLCRPSGNAQLCGGLGSAAEHGLDALRLLGERGSLRRASFLLICALT